jgi:hypothetical protein
MAGSVVPEAPVGDADESVVPAEHAAKNRADVAIAAKGAKRVCMMLLVWVQTGQET